MFLNNNHIRSDFINYPRGLKESYQKESLLNMCNYSVIWAIEVFELFADETKIVQFKMIIEFEVANEDYNESLPHGAWVN